MYKILLSLLLISSVSLFAQEIHWAKDFKSGIEQAKKENKPVLFIFSRHTCKYCVILEKTTLSNKKIIDILNRDYISIISYSDDNDYTPQELWRPGTPSIWFLQSSGEPMFQPVMGALGENSFLQALGVVQKEFDDKYKKKSGK